MRLHVSFGGLFTPPEPALHVNAIGAELELTTLLHGMSACRWRQDDDWKICRMQSVLEWDRDIQLSSFNFDWQMVARPVMQLYTESTDGSYIEEKESALVWHHRFADPDFGHGRPRNFKTTLRAY